MKVEYGFASSLRTLSQVDVMLDAMNDHTCDTFRFAMNNTAIQSGTRPYIPDAIAQFLETSNYIAISDPNHTYPQGSINSPSATTLNAVINRCKELITRFSSYGDRFIIEPLNEYTGTDHASVMNQIIASLRAFGYTGWILYNLLPGTGPQNPLTLNDPLNKIAGGFHNYFNTATVSYAMGWARKFSNAGIWSINTEIGANWNEYGSFTSTNVQKVVDYFQQSYDEGLRSDGNRKIVNMLWFNHDVDNLRPATGGRYESWANFKMPSKAPSVQYTLTVQPSINGSTTPSSGPHVYNSGDIVILTATPASGYRFDHWVINGVNQSANPIQFAITANVTVQAIFMATATPITLPFHDDFQDLANWKIVNGVWVIS